MKLTEQLEYIFMGLENGIKSDIFPKLITISEFKVMETFPIVMVQGMEVNIPVIGEIVSKTVVPSMTIAEKDELGAVIKRDGLGIGIGTV